ncbi:glycosyltransferase family A protein [Paenibacillus sp. DMB5]|uniref:glycosyltransferase family 2 protein n=1 Tax=Paenibacillus sp. DMB5 TaxID=1780103 RepID=UPI00076C9570|nr:glycosyltransferase family A protein [Paenibacillus sp. DMB5]KUP23068.1 glycosyl transferase [Paenibacillus sp. DMB5]
MPRVSVIMPVYNNAIYLQDAVNSILLQTLSDLELIIIDDGSTDGSAGIIHEIKDARVKKIFHSVNMGIVTSLNQGLDLARGEYIARMDSDDVAALNRLEVQAYFMDQNPHIDICGTGYTTNYTGPVKLNPQRHDEIKVWLLFHSCLLHPSVMMRQSSIDRLGIRYDHDYPHAEDYELWNRLSSTAQLANVPHNLMFYRPHEGQISNKHRLVQDISARRIRVKQLSQLGIQLSDEEYEQLAKLAEFRVNTEDYQEYQAAAGFANWLIDQNRQYRVFDQELFQMALSKCISRVPY